MKDLFLFPTIFSTAKLSYGANDQDQYRASAQKNANSTICARSRSAIVDNRASVSRGDRSGSGAENTAIAA